MDSNNNIDMNDEKDRANQDSMDAQASVASSQEATATTKAAHFRTRSDTASTFPLHTAGSQDTISSDESSKKTQKSSDKDEKAGPQPVNLEQGIGTLGIGCILTKRNIQMQTVLMILMFASLTL